MTDPYDAEQDARSEARYEGEDENGKRCWRTYVGMTKPNGEIMFSRETLAYSPPNDWDESDGA